MCAAVLDRSKICALGILPHKYALCLNTHPLLLLSCSLSVVFEYASTPCLNILPPLLIYVLLESSHRNTHGLLLCLFAFRRFAFENTYWHCSLSILNTSCFAYVQQFYLQETPRPFLPSSSAMASCSGATEHATVNANCVARCVSEHS